MWALFGVSPESPPPPPAIIHTLSLSRSSFFFLLNLSYSLWFFLNTNGCFCISHPLHRRNCRKIEDAGAIQSALFSTSPRVASSLGPREDLEKECAGPSIMQTRFLWSIHIAPQSPRRHCSVPRILVFLPNRQTASMWVPISVETNEINNNPAKYFSNAWNAATPLQFLLHGKTQLWNTKTLRNPSISTPLSNISFECLCVCLCGWAKKYKHDSHQPYCCMRLYVQQRIHFIASQFSQKDSAIRVWNPLPLV